jgi:putative transposase
MARIARAVAAGVPHHIIQRGNRLQPVFFRDADYELYLELMADWCGMLNVEVWAYCLMETHVHLIAVPSTQRGLAWAVGEAHRRYTWEVNRRKGWTGYLWQGRFMSYPMDERHLLMAARYVEQNPVRARMVRKPWNYRWSSARAHVRGKDDVLVRVKPLLKLKPDWEAFISERLGGFETELVELHGRTGRPLGDADFVALLERRLHRRLGPRPPGRPRKKRI